MENLHSICFWRAGLTKPALEYFVNFLPQCQHLKELCVDNNAIPEQCFHIIIEGNSVQHLSLRHCSIDNEGAKQIGLAIAGVKEPRKPKLISLNLTGNYIGDEGVAYIASALRHNRTLLSLSLGNNKIGDAGACGLAGILCPSPLSHEEMVEHRRKLLSIVEALLAEALLASHEPTGLTSPRRHSPVPVSPREGKRKLSKEATDIKGKGAKEKGADKTSAKGKRVGKADSKKDIVKGKDNTTSVTSVNKKAHRKEKVSALMPLSSECCIKDDHICPGNRVLINLNLARNQIGEDGLTALLAALRHQEDVTQAGWKEGRGLLRLCVDKNQVSLDSNVLREIKEIMNSRDPCGGPVRPTSAE